MKLPQPAHKIIPHRDSMLLIDTLVSSKDGLGQAQAILEDTCISVDESGILAPLIYVELVAQTYAAVKGWEIIQAGKEFPVGYLVGIQKFDIIESTKSGTQLSISVATVGEFEGFAVVEGTISANGTTLAQGKIKLWVPQEGDA